MRPDRVHRNQADNNSRLIELYSVLGYNLPDLPLSVEGIHKVHPAKSAPACPGSPEFENLTHDSFVAGKTLLLLLYLIN